MGVAGTEGTTFIFTEELFGEVQPRLGSEYEKENEVPGVSPVMAATFPTPD
jgi:hypothetical protein